ncbi:hypothetical protein EV127DRAFT_448818 [Xylaria flabelliformis]|nr:hypothetical protein EV127DRAFT_448818 [Xylaria flabelliformis]
MLFIQSFLKNVLLASLAATSLAVPIHDNPISLDIREVAVGKRGKTPPLPSVQDCKDHLKVEKDTTLFYSGPGGYAKKARDAIKHRDYLKGYKILGQLWTDSKWQDQWQNDEQASKDFFNICSKALAELSTGTSYVLLPKGKGHEWQSGTVWDKFEWPNIPSATKVIRIDPDNAKDEETIKG